MHDHETGGHDHSRSAVNKKRLAIVLALTGSYMGVEIAGGLLTGSLALLAEAAHMFTDVAGLALAYVAIKFAERPATPERTYGYHRVEILAALANSVVLICLSVFILIEAVERLTLPPEVHGKGMFAVASFGLLVNAIGIVILRAGATESLNVKAAYFEVLSDAVSALGVMAASVLIWSKGWRYADPLVSIGIGLFILPRTWALLKEAVGVLLEGTPADIQLPAVRESMRAVSGVREVHDLHVWTLTTGVYALSAHAMLAEGASHEVVLEALRDCLASKFKIGHITIQVEPNCGGEGVHE